ncbi:hypothetical protein [Streptomyces sp. RerS4]|uniref:hypothetical protein n=1 Tax=Streptomyces sp. RerS4 TaxID=2942449 RepID=UPI00201C55E7|nr:hypothetical protein [Streptomyces sp. RerS4]UQX04555.1 hypothetical protein M4D82_31610 [Streptomyces sp. RerS4]
MAYDQNDTERAILEVIRAMREDPEKYKSVIRELEAMKTDEERVSRLFTFATGERDLAALLPARAGADDEAATPTITTVTVTTVLVEC